MSKKLSKDSASLCTSTTSDGRRCTTPRSKSSPHFCHYHARKDQKQRNSERVRQEITGGLSDDFVTACGLNATLARLFEALVRGDINRKTAGTLAYLAQTMLQTMPFAEREFAHSFGRHNLEHVVTHAYGHVNPRFLASFRAANEPPDLPQQPALPPSTQSDPRLNPRHPSYGKGL